MKATVKQSAVLRSAPSAIASEVDKLGPGVELNVLVDYSTAYPGWSYVKVTKTNKAGDGVGERGYIATRFIDIEQPPPPDIPKAETLPECDPPWNAWISRVVVAIFALAIIAGAAWLVSCDYCKY